MHGLPRFLPRDREADGIEGRRSHEEFGIAGKPYAFAGNPQHLVDAAIAILVMQDQQRIIPGRQPRKIKLMTAAGTDACRESGRIILAIGIMMPIAGQASAKHSF